MPSTKTPDDYWSRIPRLNVRWTNGGLENRVIASRLAGTDPKLIEWVYMVEEKRNATPEEIRKFCKKETPPR